MPVNIPNISNFTFTFTIFLWTLSCFTLTRGASVSSPLESSLPLFVQQALQWGREQWTDGNVTETPFYTAPANSSNATPGTLLKLEEFKNTSTYALPPATALSRFIYQSETLNGTKVPVSAYILWPYSARESADGYQVVAWAHGTSGLAPNTAPSHHKNLWQHFLAPYNLVLQGYIVVATDYAGLGVAKTASGEPIVHEYATGPSQANDVIYSVQAAQKAFPQLGKKFVVMGHSQGGAAAWSCAQRQAIKPVEGYLGAITVAPITSVLKEPEPMRSILALGMIDRIANLYSDLDLSKVYTPEGLERAAIIKELEPVTSTFFALTSDVQLFQTNWAANSQIQKYQDLILNGGRAIAEPLLVIKGDADPILQYNITVDAVRDTSERFPQSSIEFIHLPGVSHDSALTSSQRYWMDWISDRFCGKEAEVGLKELQVKAGRPLEAYQPALNWYLSIATEVYQMS